MKRFTIGDTFTMSLRIYTDNNIPIILDDTIQVIGYVKDTYNTLMSMAIIEIQDQTESPGWITITIPSIDTNTWPQCHATLRIKTIRDNLVITFSDTVFIVIA